MYAENYFDPTRKRMVKPLGGNAKGIEPYYLVGLYQPEQLMDMVEQVRGLCKEVVSARFAKVATESKSMYIVTLTIMKAIMDGRKNLTGNSVLLVNV